MKICSKCKINPKLENNPSYCRECRNAYSREWTKKNPGYSSRSYDKKKYEKMKPWIADRRKRNVAFIQEQKKGKKCEDCGGGFHPAAMHYHHTDKKKYNIGRMGHSTHSLETIMKEINKCILICANCHAVRTWGGDYAY